MISHNKMDKQPEIYLLLHNIRSIHNVGSIFRTADAANVKKIYLSGHTPTPLDRFGRMRKDIEKVSLGAENSIEWEYIEDMISFLKKIKKDKVKIISIEQDKRSIDFRKGSLSSKNLLILGNEVNGIEKDVLDISDEILEIPMMGKKESLNVSVTAGIVLFCLQKLP